MAFETVTVTVAGTVLADWTSIEISASAEAAVRTASLQLPLAAVRGLKIGDAATVTAGDDVLLTGFVRDRDRAHGSTDNSATLSLVNKTADAVETSVDHPTGYVERAGVDGIAKALDPRFEIVNRAKSLPEVAYHQIVPGESVHATIERVARRQGVLVYDDGEGRIVLADAPTGRHRGGLAYGVNILQASARETEQGRVEAVVVRGQAMRAHGAGALGLEARAADAGVRAGRGVAVILLEGEVTSAEAERRAEYSARRRAGRSVTASVSTPGWRDADGVLWTPHFLVHVDDDALELVQDMAIASVTYRQDGTGGTTADLALVDPRALGGEDPKGASGGAWAAPLPKAKSAIKGLLP